MTNPSVLLELAGRVEALTGDGLCMSNLRVVEREITLASGWSHHVEQHDDDLSDDVWTDPEGIEHPWFPFCLTSIDAAMSLASEFSGQVTFFRDGGAKAFLWQRYPQALEVKAATPALALTAACLRALAAREG